MLIRRSSRLPSRHDVVGVGELDGRIKHHRLSLPTIHVVNGPCVLHHDADGVDLDPDVERRRHDRSADRHNDLERQGGSLIKLGHGGLDDAALEAAEGDAARALRGERRPGLACAAMWHAAAFDPRH